MQQRKKTKYGHEGSYVAEVEVEILDEEGGWSPYLSVEDAGRLDDVREALRLFRSGKRIINVPCSRGIFESCPILSLFDKPSEDHSQYPRA